MTPEEMREMLRDQKTIARLLKKYSFTGNDYGEVKIIRRKGYVEIGHAYQNSMLYWHNNETVKARYEAEKRPYGDKYVTVNGKNGTPYKDGVDLSKQN